MTQSLYQYRILNVAKMINGARERQRDFVLAYKDEQCNFDIAT